jgi:hypothetical protein
MELRFGLVNLLIFVRAFFGSLLRTLGVSSGSIPVVRLWKALA